MKVSNIIGTRGYLEPEYWMRDNQPITKKLDVYNFGIVILQIVSRRKIPFFSQSIEEGDGCFFPNR